MDTINSFHGVGGHLAKLQGVQREVLKRRGDLSGQALTVWEVIGVAEHSDVGVKVLEVVFCVVRGN